VLFVRVFKLLKNYQTIKKVTTTVNSYWCKVIWNDLGVTVETSINTNTNMDGRKTRFSSNIK